MTLNHNSQSSVNWFRINLAQRQSAMTYMCTSIFFMIQSNMATRMPFFCYFFVSLNHNSNIGELILFKSGTMAEHYDLYICSPIWPQDGHFFFDFLLIRTVPQTSGTDFVQTWHKSKALWATCACLFILWYHPFQYAFKAAIFCNFSCLWTITRTSVNWFCSDLAQRQITMTYMCTKIMGHLLNVAQITLVCKSQAWRKLHQCHSTAT